MAAEQDDVPDRRRHEQSQSRVFENDSSFGEMTGNSGYPSGDTKDERPPARVMPSRKPENREIRHDGKRDEQAVKALIR